MELVYQVATLAELDEILAFAEKKLADRESDPQARMFLSWHARWRRESLEHYLKLGWSFLVRRKSASGDARLAGFFLAQPLLFVRGMTQTLWVEHLDADVEDARAGLTDVAVRMARDKHLQRVLFGEAESVERSLGTFKHSRLSDAIIEVATTKA